MLKGCATRVTMHMEKIGVVLQPNASIQIEFVMRLASVPHAIREPSFCRSKISRKMRQKSNLSKIIFSKTQLS